MGIVNSFFQSRAADTVRVTVSTHNGKVRGNNEDNFSVNGMGKSIADDIYNLETEFGKDALLLEVCDGMGGEENGEIASEIAVKCSSALYKKLKCADDVQITETVNDYVKTANAEICRELNNSEDNRGGSTFALVYIKNGVAYAYSLGDSRIYLFSNGELKQISTDHTLAMLKYNANIYTLEEAEKSADSHKLTLFLGADVTGRGLTAQAYEPFELPPDSKILLCSDGLYDMCSRDEICEILSSKSKNHAQALVDAALDNGGIDNVTCLVAEIY